jgi:hypothetical protein
MVRWAIRLGTIWVILLLPSLVGWGLVVRWNEAGPGRFERVWDWLANLVAFPILIQAVTDRSWRWLRGDTPLLATLGFVILLATWCLMIALPASVILSWADWVGRNLLPDTSATSDPYATYETTATSSSALNVIYLVTVPMALLYHLGRWFARLISPAMTAFVVAWMGYFGFYFIGWYRSSQVTWSRQLMGLRDAWQGYLATLGMHRLFTTMWNRYFDATMRLSFAARGNYYLWQHMLDHPREYPDVLKLFALSATMHALIIAIAFAILWGLFHLGSSHT